MPDIPKMDTELILILILFKHCGYLALIICAGLLQDFFNLLSSRHQQTLKALPKEYIFSCAV